MVMLLNEQQQAAVEITEGPVLIVAGAGTGKTGVIAHRISRLINLERDITPFNILALTFSKRAAEEMLQRTEQLIQEHKDELLISTFHGFCHRILRDHAMDAGLPFRFRLLDRVEQWIFFKRHVLPKLKLKFYSNIANPTDCIDGFLRFIGRAKNELVGPDDYFKYVKKIEDKQEADRQKEVTEVYRAYEGSKLKEGCLDFADLILKVNKLFVDRPDILARFQERFKYILVDEFQDTNVAQIELVSILAGRMRNICAVGDDDQAIYRFRGASYASFLLFKERFPDLKLIKLTQNYRSTKNILSVAERVIRNNGEDRYDPQKNLWSQNQKGTAVTLISTPDYTAQAKAVFDQIKRLLAELPPQERDFSNFAILYRAHSHKEKIAELLKRENIPYAMHGGSGILEQDQIKDIISFLKIIEDPDDSVNLFRILSSEFIGMGLFDLIELNRYSKKRECSLYAALQNLKDLKINPQTKRRLADFKERLYKLMTLAKREGVAAVSYEVLKATRHLEGLLMRPETDNQIKILNISRFFQLINDFVLSHEDAGLESFLEYLDSYKEAGGDIGQQEDIIVAKGVQLMTVHQAKGLQFPYVFIIGLNQYKFPTRQRPEPIAFPQELMKEKLPAGDYQLEEERRLFYVAVTRAMERLYILYVERPYHRPSTFVKEAGGKDETDDVVWQVFQGNGQEKKGQWIESNLPSWEFKKLQKKMIFLENLDSLEGINLQDEDQIAQRLDTLKKDFLDYLNLVREKEPPQTYKDAPLSTAIIMPKKLSLSYSQVDTYLSCPLKYKFSYVYLIPTRPTAPLSFGTDIHVVLREFYNRLKEGLKPSYELLRDIYISRWSGVGYKDKKQKMEYNERGFKILEEYYNTNKETMQPPLYIEEEFLLKVGQHGLKGFIDRIDQLEDGTVEVIDYKTGKPRGQDFIDKNLQLDIYAIACKEVLKLAPSILSLYYLENNSKVSVAPAEERLERTRRVIFEVVDKILAQEFPSAPGRQCGWCDYKDVCPNTEV